MKARHRIQLVVGFVSLAGVVVTLRQITFRELDRQVHAAANPVLSERVDIGRPGTAVWHLPRSRWVNTAGEHEVRLAFRRVEGVPFERYERDSLGIAAECRVYAPEPDGRRSLRRTLSFGKVSQPESRGAFGLYSSWSAEEVQHVVGTFQSGRADSMILEFELKASNGLLVPTEPRLVVYASHDHAALAHGGVFLALRDLVALLCLLVLVRLAWTGWRKSAPDDAPRAHEAG